MKKLLLALALALGVSPAFAADNYTATAGSGLTFAAKDNGSGVLFSRFIGCDNITTTQCWAVDASGRITVNLAAASTVAVTAAASSYAAGALSAGAFAAGAGVDGWDITQGAKADSVCATSTGTCSVTALIKFLNTQAASIVTNTGAAIPPGTASIGQVGADPSSGKATPTMAFLAFPATTTTQIIALSGTKVTYVTMAKVFSGGAVNLTFKYGTGSNCGTGTTTLEGPYALTAQAGWTEGNGSGPVMIVPSGQALCVTTDATVTNSGVKLVYQQF